MKLLSAARVVPEASRRYDCTICDKEFNSSSKKPACPNCGAHGKDTVILIYVEDEPEKELMFTRADWNAGD